MRFFASIISVFASIAIVACDDPDTVIDESEVVESEQPEQRPLAQDPVVEDSEDQGSAQDQALDELAAPPRMTPYAPLDYVDCCGAWIGDIAHCENCKASHGGGCTCRGN